MFQSLIKLRSMIIAIDSELLNIVRHYVTHFIFRVTWTIFSQTGIYFLAKMLKGRQTLLSNSERVEVTKNFIDFQF